MCMYIHIYIYMCVCVVTRCRQAGLLYRGAWISCADQSFGSLEALARSCKCNDAARAQRCDGPLDMSSGVQS